MFSELLDDPITSLYLILDPSVPLQHQFQTLSPSQAPASAPPFSVSVDKLLPYFARRASWVAQTGKESACNEGDPGSIPGWGRSPGKGSGTHCSNSCLENSTDRGTWWAKSMGSQRVGDYWVANSIWSPLHGQETLWVQCPVGFVFFFPFSFLKFLRVIWALSLFTTHTFWSFQYGFYFIELKLLSRWPLLMSSSKPVAIALFVSIGFCAKFHIDVGSLNSR